MVADSDAGREVVVTGGSSGIGLALVRRLAAEGHTVTSIARRPCPVEGAAVRSLCCDLADPGAVQGLHDPGRERTPDAVVFCHGKGDFGAIEQFSERRIRQMVELHLTATLLLCRALLPSMKRRGGGNLVFVGSEAALRGGRQGVVYSATKFALRGAAQALREECSSSGIRVGIVNPGMVDTPFFAPLDFAPGEDPENRLTAEEVVDAILLILNAPANASVDEVNLTPLKKVVRRK